MIENVKMDEAQKLEDNLRSSVGGNAEIKQGGGDPNSWYSHM